MSSDLISAEGFHFYLSGEKWLVRGVTYGPFAPGSTGDSYPPEDRLNLDFEQISAAGFNTVRLYDLPHGRVATCAAKHDLRLLVDIPWPKHLDVYDDSAVRQMCLDMVHNGVQQLSGWDNVIGVFLGNEIPSDIVRWHGAKKVERLIRDMYLKAKAVAPHLLCGFANYPSTEYLELDFLDFVGFNVYLNDPRALKEYLVRLRHLYPDKPLLLSECGLDSRSSGFDKQREILPEYVCAGFETGLAGVLIFAWTDEWFTGGAKVSDWDFGLVDRARVPKPAFDPVAYAVQTAPQCREASTSISVVIATYNGGRTLRQCLESVGQLKYPEFEIIVVDDGSTDDTADILSEFPWVRVVSQPNYGLSVARNAGIKESRGDIVAFTDSDCVVDPDWLYFIGLFLTDHPEMAGVGGPNITPLEDDLAAKAVALAPGHATHVLLTYTEAEHVPGCNMAFRKSALDEIGGFDPLYRKAGDDVDVIWRLQDRGHTIGFSTAAFVWHHRRSTLTGYLKQQRGYGEAETLLLLKHPSRFNDRGQSVWRGIIYPSHAMRSYMSTKRVQYGTFGTAGYQCIYQGSPAQWYYNVTSSEWWCICLLILLAGMFSPAAFILGFAGILVSAGVSGTAAISNWPSSSVYPKRAFPLVWLLWILQPLVRGGARYWYRLKLMPFKAPVPRAATHASGHSESIQSYWAEEPGPWRTEVLALVEQEMLTRQWVCTSNGLWDNWDLSVVLSPWFKTRITSLEVCLGSFKRLLKMRYQLVPSSLLYLATIGGLVASLLIALYDTILARWFLIALLIVFLWCYRHALNGRREVAELAGETIGSSGYAPLSTTKSESSFGTPVYPASDALKTISEKKEAGNV